MEFRRIIKAENDIYFNEDGSQHIDMFAANGTVLLGHGNESVVAEVRKQLEAVWNTGAIETSVRVQARELVESFFPSTHRLASFYSTGMEAAEFALRVARLATGRSGVAGFEKSMHGKSLATAYLAWDNKGVPELSGWYRLPFPHSGREEEILGQLGDLLGDEQISAVFIEPLQGSGGGYMANPEFYREAYRLCQESGTLLVFDEILTGFHRTGEAFFHTDLGFVPDIILVGKAIGNGFPVSAVVVNEQYPIEPAMLPGSTYAGNPLASASVVGTLQTMKSMDLHNVIIGIEKTISSKLSMISEVGAILRGKGALWVIELPSAAEAMQIADAVYERGVIISRAGPYLRLLPPVTIAPEHLDAALNIISEELLRQSE